MEESFSAEPESSCQPRNTTIKYEDVYGGIPVNLGINVAVWLVSLVTAHVNTKNHKYQVHWHTSKSYHKDCRMAGKISLVATVSQETQLSSMGMYTVAYQ